MKIRELLEELDKLGVVIRHDGKQMTINPVNKVTPELMAELKVHKPMLLAAWTDPKVKRVVEATQGRIVDVGDFETAVMMNGAIKP